MSKMKMRWTKADTEGVIVGSVCGGITGFYADSLDFHRGIAMTIGGCIAVAVYSMYYGIRTNNK